MCKSTVKKAMINEIGKCMRLPNLIQVLFDLYN